MSADGAALTHRSATDSKALLPFDFEGQLISPGQQGSWPGSQHLQEHSEDHQHSAEERQIYYVALSFACCPHNESVLLHLSAAVPLCSCFYLPQCTWDCLKDLELCALFLSVWSASVCRIKKLNPNFHENCVWLWTKFKKSKENEECSNNTSLIAIWIIF